MATKGPAARGLFLSAIHASLAGSAQACRSERTAAGPSAGASILGQYLVPTRPWMRSRSPMLSPRQAAGLAVVLLMPLANPGAAGEACEPAAAIEERARPERALERSDADDQAVAAMVPSPVLLSQQPSNRVLHEPHGCARAFAVVACGADVDHLREALMDVARSHSHALTDGSRSRKPAVRCPESGDSALVFEPGTGIRQRFVVTGEISFAIEAAFHQSGIETPLPRRDLRIRRWSNVAVQPLTQPPTQRGGSSV